MNLYVTMILKIGRLMSQLFREQCTSILRNPLVHSKQPPTTFKAVYSVVHSKQPQATFKVAYSVLRNPLVYNKQPPTTINNLQGHLLCTKESIHSK